MAEYTYADIITGKDVLTDLVKDNDIIGVRGYFTDNLQTIVDSLDDETFPDSLLEGTVETVSYAGRFKRKADGKYYSYFIRKKEPEKKYVPFDLALKEDRAKLRGAWIRIKDIPNIEYQITGMNAKYVLLGNAENLETDDLLRSYEFVDGFPCGKLVEVEG